MLNVGIIGLGNAGNQVAVLAKEKLNIPVIAINSSEKDLETVPDSIPKKKITDKDGISHGAGKDRMLAKKFLKDSVMKLLKDEDVTSMITDYPKQIQEVSKEIKKVAENNEEIKEEDDKEKESVDSEYEIFVRYYITMVIEPSEESKRE